MTTPPTPPGQRHRGGLQAWIRAHQGEAAAIGIGGAVALAFLIRRMASGSSSSGTTGTANSATGVQSGVAYGYGDGTGYFTSDSQYAEQQAALDEFLNSYTQGTLGGQLFPNGLPPTTSSPAPPPAPPKKTVNPGGFNVGTTHPIITRQRTITVPQGASLLSLSQKYLGTSNRTALAHANHLGTGAGLRAGQTLIIPAH